MPARNFSASQLVKFGTGSLSARNVTENGPDGTVKKVEVTYVPPLGNVAVDPLYSPDLRRPGPEVHAAHRPARQPGAGRNAIQNERRLSLALRSGGYAAWDHDYRTGETYNSPEIYDLLGFDRGSQDLNFNSFNDLVHPDDQDKTLDGQIKTVALRLRHVPDPLSRKEPRTASMSGSSRSPASSAIRLTASR